MPMLKSALLTLIFLSLSWHESARCDAPRKEQPKGELYLDCDLNYVKSLPVVLKIEAHGPLQVAEGDFFDDHAKIRVTLKSESGQTYEIRSTQVMGGEAIGAWPDGGLREIIFTFLDY